MNITSIPNWQTLTAVEIVAYLEETVTERKPADPNQAETAWATGARGLRDFTPIVWEQMVGHIRQMGLNETANQIVSGMDYGDPATLAMVDQLAMSAPSVFTPERVATLKAWGQTARKRYELHGYGALPTVEAIQAEIAAESAEADETRHEVLLSCNRGTDGTLKVFARVTPVEFAEGVELRRGEPRTLVNDANLVAALVPIVEGLI